MGAIPNEISWIFWKVMKITKNWYKILVLIVICINLFVLIYIIRSTKIKNRYYQEKVRSSQSLIRQNNDSNFYDLPCPEISFPSIDGRNISLKDYIGNVIILRFSRFYLLDLPDLLYLEHVAKRFKTVGVSLLFINTLGKHNSQAISKYITLSSPIIEDDSTITALFNSNRKDTIIIGRDFKIKFKYNQADNLTIFDQVTRQAIEDSPSIDTSDETLNNLIMKLSFRDISSNETENIRDRMKGKKTILNLSISTCIGCSEGRKIGLINEISQKINLEHTQIILLFGRGNSTEMIKEFSGMMALDTSSIRVGVIENGESLSEEEYYKIFKYDINPRLLVFNEGGNLIFSEKLIDSNKMNADYILSKIR